MESLETVIIIYAYISMWKMCDIKEANASAKFYPNDSNDDMHNFYFIFNSNGPRYLRFIILDEGLSNLCHGESGNAYSLPTSRHPRLLERSIRNAFPLVRWLHATRKCRLGLSWRASKGLNIYSHIFVAFCPIFNDYWMSLSIFRGLRFRATFGNLIHMNDYRTKISDYDIDLMLSLLKKIMYMFWKFWSKKFANC